MRRTRLIITGAVIGIIILIAGYIFYEKTFTAPFLSDKMLENLKTSAAEQNELAFMQPLFQPAEYPENDPLKNAYFGELHVHSSLSFDSYLFGNRLTIDQAYHFAKGTSMENAIGENMRLTRPLDFIAVTDHAESFGLFEACADSTISEATTESCQRFNRPNLKFFLELRELGEQRPIINPLEVNEGKERARFFANMTWDKIVSIADEHNEPGIFTAFAAYEYSPVLPDSGKHHRNVIFRNSHVPKNAVSAFDALTEIDLWNMLSEDCKDPCEFLTIPHNPNRTWGLAFVSHTIDGDAYTIDDWKQRDKFEPLVEMYQVKGSSECSIGFGSTDEEGADDESTNRFLAKAETRDFIKYGFEPEFVGRLPVRVACEELTKEDLGEILHSSEGNVLEQYKNDFDGYCIDFKIDDEAIERIAEQAADEKTGARGLVTVLERTFRDFKFELPSSGIRNFAVSARTVDHPKESLAELLEQNRDQLDESMLADVDRFTDDFKREHGFLLRMRKPAKVALVKIALKENRSVRAVCEKKFSDYEHGLGIISQRTGKKEFVIEKKTIDDPDKELSRWVVDSFGSKKSPE